MFAKISYDDSSGRTRSMQVRQGQRLIIGSSFSADVVVGNSQGVASEHAEIYLKQRGFSIRNITGKADLVLVNGQPTAKAKLSDGDSIEIGNNRLLVEVEGEPQSPTAATSAAVATSAVAAGAVAASVPGAAEESEAASASPDLPLFERHPNGVVTITVSSFLKDAFPLLSEPKSAWKHYLICNHKRSQSEKAPPESENFLAAHQDSVTADNDLYLVPQEDPEDTAVAWEEYVMKDAGCIGIVSGEDKVLLAEEQFRFVASWFMMASTLRFHLTRGSSLLLNKVFGMFDILVLANPDGAGDFIMTQDAGIDSYEALLEKIKGVAK